LTHTFVVKNDRRTIGTDEYRNPGTNHQGFWMIDSHPISADQLHNVRLKRRTSLERANGRLKVLSRHKDPQYRGEYELPTSA